MKYSKISAYFDKGEEGIIELLKDITPMLDTIDEYAGQFIGDSFSGTDELRTAKTVLAGIIANLQPIYSKALSVKKQKEYRYYAATKAEAGDKFKDGATEKLAKDNVASFRNLRDILKGYLNSAEAMSFDARDRIIGNQNEYNKTKEA